MTTSLFDPGKPAHETARRKLENDQIAWLTTLRADGRPHTVPVWFLWHDGRVVVFSEAETVKTRNVRRRGDVAVSLHTGPSGDDVVVLDGTAAISDDDTATWVARNGPAYEAKYADGIRGLGQTMDRMAAQYATVIVVTPSKLTAW